MVQVLTANKVRNAARRAMKNGKLTAQHRVQEKRECIYKSGSYNCAIGAALNRKTMKRIIEDDLNAGAPVGDLSAHNIINFASIEDEDRICEMQAAHDDWASASQNLGAKDPLTQRRRQSFIESMDF